MARVLRTLVILAVIAGGLWTAWSAGWIGGPRWTAKPSPLASPPPPSPSPSPRGHLLRVGVDDRAACLALYGVLDSLSRGNDSGLRIEWVSVADGQLRWQMLAAGRLDLAAGSMDSWIRSLPLVPGALLCKMGTSSGADVLVSEPSVGDLRQLKDKTVAVVAGGPGRYLMTCMLDQQGMFPSDIRILEVEQVEDARALLEQGRVQAAWVWQPYAASLLSRGFHRLNAVGQVPSVDDVLVANGSSLPQAREDIQTFLQAWFELVAHLNSNPAITEEQVAQQLTRVLRKTSPAELGEALDGESFIDLAENRKLDVDTVVRQMRDIQWKLKLNGTIDPHTAIDLDLLTEVTAPPSSIRTLPPAPSPSPSPKAPGPSPSAQASNTPGPPSPSPSPSPTASPEEEPSPNPP